jgi:tetraacyldisaccharide 4'-kinase
MDVAWRYLLLPLAPIYRGAVTARAAAYRRGWRRQGRLDIPVISIGNLTFGGTGKTPTVIALARDLVRMGRRPAVLTRGYKRLDDQQQVVMGPDPRQSVVEVGDEPLEMAHRLPGVPVVVDADRVRGGAEAQRLGADVVLLDDGFQHLRLERDLDVVVIDAGDPWGGGRLPPLGRLREPITALARADAVVITKVPSEWRPVVGEIERELEGVAPKLQVYVSRLRPSRVRVPDRGWEEPKVLEGRRVFAFAAIGRPAGFEATLRDAGADIAGTSWFPDHHSYTDLELSEVVERASAASAVPVTTAKDAVKLRDGAGVWVIEAAVEPIEGNWNGLWRMLPEVRA